MPSAALYFVALTALLAVPRPAASRDAGAQAALAALERSNAPMVRTVLDNGLVCLVKQDRSAPVVAVQIWVGTGSIHEERFLGSGISHAFEHMVFKGTRTRGAGDISRAIDNAGGDINAYTGFDRTVFHAVMPAARWTIGLEVLADAVRNASLPAAEWKPEKQVILREIAMRRDDPNRVLADLLWRTAYRVHPYRFPVIGYESLLRRVERADLAAFFERHYEPGNMIAVVVGDVSPAEAQAGLQRVFGDFERRPRAPVTVPPEPRQIAPRSARRTGDYGVTRLTLAYHTVPLGHPDAAALDVLAEVVGGGRSSRLVRELKEERRLAHSIEAWSYTPGQPGLFGIDATLDPASEEELRRALQREVASWSAARFSGRELAKARRASLTAELASLQTMKGQADSLAAGEFFAGNPRFAEHYLAQVAAVTPDDLSSVAARYLRRENSTLVVLAPNRGTESAAEPTAAAPAASLHRRVLPGGVRLLVREDRRLPFVYFCAALRGGLLSEDETNSGITRLMADLLTRGTRRRSAAEIAGAVESLGGSLSAFAGYNSFGLNARCLAADTDAFAALLAECLLQPAFPAEELSKQKAVQLAAIAQQHERPFYLAQEALAGLLFPRHPYRWSPLGRAPTVSDITRDSVRRHHQRHLHAGNLVVAVFGDCGADRADELMRRCLAGIPPGQASLPEHSPPGPDLPARIEIESHHRQAVLLAGFPGLSVRDPRADALSVLDTVLSGLSSDLATAVREERGLAYFVGSYRRLGLEPGAFVLYAGTRPEAANEVELLMREEAKRLAVEGLREEEMTRARNKLLADHAMDQQDNAGLAMNCALNELYGLGFDHTLKTPERLRALTPEEVRRTAAALLATNRMAVAVVLPEPEPPPPQPQP